MYDPHSQIQAFNNAKRKWINLYFLRFSFFLSLSLPSFLATFFFLFVCSLPRCVLICLTVRITDDDCYVRIVTNSRLSYISISNPADIDVGSHRIGGKDLFQCLYLFLRVEYRFFLLTALIFLFASHTFMPAFTFCKLSYWTSMRNLFDAITLFNNLWHHSHNFHIS